MATQGEILTLFKDVEKTQGIFPRTKVSAISDEDNVSLEILLNEKASSENLQLKLYSNITQIGLVAGSETIEAIAQNLPDNSILVYPSMNTSLYPTPSGVLFVVKWNSARTIFEYTNILGGRWTGAYYDNVFTGWKQVAICEYDSASNTLNFIL